MKTDSTVANGSTFLVTDEDGVPTRGHDGFYHRDTRRLDSYRLGATGRTLEPLELVDVRPAERLVHLATPLERGARSLQLSRRQFVTDGLYESVRVTNLTRDPRSETLELAVGTRFDDLFEVRGFEGNELCERDIDVELHENGATFAYDADDADDVDDIDFAARVSVVVSRDAAVSVDTADGRVDATLSIPLDLDAGETREISLAVTTDGPAAEPDAAADAARDAVREREREWNEATTLDDVPEGWESVLEESRENLLELRLDTDYGPMLAAGVPWFATAFGRDSLIAAYQSLGLSTELAKGTCRYLAAHQVAEVDAFRDAEPGKILHEVRYGELAARGEVPHSPYYGTVDATALFVVLVHETWKRTGDDAFAEELRPHVERALDWLDEYGDRDDDGFLEYPTDGGDGSLTHQAWKDSGDGIMHPDGEHPEGPLAVAEVQGYAYDAKRRAADLARRAGDEERAAELAREAADLEEAFDEAFWLPEEECYAVALDGEKEQVASVTTNAGHCLWSGIVPEARADALVDRLVADDMFTGWGIRTLAASHDVYNPQSYHLGSVWPHDNSLVVLGMARYGRVDAARKVAEGLVDAAEERGNDRLPELFAGFEREQTEVPVSYGEACEPQAWAAAAPLAFLQAVAGSVAEVPDEPDSRDAPTPSS
ncbi:glycogen debranching N-terminal domain-containing protein [Haloprofundus halobius]|uniref:glycogen debranching N-terminal domain-containing protein n=1 Tax=Haloprofundus halobius TaxID=2876194 RepID=UPI001CCFD9E1|nr:glycogen debranching N-terminal domain-containing protein [Haloprofundus halobius]